MSDIKYNIPKWARTCAVTDCANLHEFLRKYYKRERFTGRGEKYVNVVIASHRIDLEEKGFTSISHHDNVTGQFICYIGKETDW